jgi:hypothetical protein
MSDMLVVSIIRSINLYALVSRFADVADGSASQKGEIQRSFKIEIGA